MADHANIVVHFKDLEVDEELRDHIEGRCTHLAAEFPEVTRFEVTLEPGPNSVECHGLVSGKRTRVAAHANGAELPRQACDAFLDKIERELRTEHDKRIFTQRRKAQKNRRNPGA